MPPSAETFARTFSHLLLTGLRHLQHSIYTRLKRNKALGKIYGFHVAAIDGHETSSSFKSWCPGCLKRMVGKKEGKVEQYYHRNATLMLITPRINLTLDAEEQRPGEDETRCATRLFQRAVKDYPRAFDLVLCDALYSSSTFFQVVTDAKKDIIAVLKGEQRDLLKDAEGIFSQQEPLIYSEGKTTYRVWDEEDFRPWGSAGISVRVGKSIETTSSISRLTGKPRTDVAVWMWATTIKKNRLGARALVALGHKRWTIENNGFKEMVHLWHGDHVYNHHPVSIIAFWLVTMIAHNILHAFVEFNIKPVFRKRHTFLYFADTVRAAISAEQLVPLRTSAPP